MLGGSGYNKLISEFNKKLQSFHGKVLDTFVEKNPFRVQVDSEWITAITASSGKLQRIRRTNAEAAISVLVEKGILTKKQMEDMRGLSGLLS